MVFTCQECSSYCKIIIVSWRRSFYTSIRFSMRICFPCGTVWLCLSVFRVNRIQGKCRRFKSVLRKKQLSWQSIVQLHGSVEGSTPSLSRVSSVGRAYRSYGFESHTLCKKSWRNGRRTRFRILRLLHLLRVNEKRRSENVLPCSLCAAAETGQQRSGYRKTAAHPIAIICMEAGCTADCSSFVPLGDRGRFRRFPNTTKKGEKHEGYYQRK